ncbi:hybrid sensor histidine kinase/response regulator transcription factor [Dactylosporangium sp. NPDC048998]|uniref:helix-turn-helix transcriptional regulator n=1 Tax=Dactylosporangium sp. NPDC048998 TaxID=3363976 RepID=UPI003711BC45
MNRQAWRDLGLAAAVTVLALAGAATAPQARMPLDATGVLFLAVAGLALAGLRRFPRLVMVVAAACLLAYLVLGYPGVGPALPVLFALYATVRIGARRTAAVAIGAILVGGVAGEVASTSEPPPDVFERWFLLIGWMVAASVFAEVTRHRRAYLEQVERRAEDAERTREETARRRADEERLRIARELHDSLTHSISIIKVQAGVAVHLAHKRGEPVPEALLAIQHASGDAMRELRNTLEVLRSEPPAPPGADPVESGLERLDQLVDGARRAGLPVSVHIEGRPRELPGEVDGAAYRIVQEALTNVARHAGPASAAVCIGYGDLALTVRIDDDGCGAVQPVPGVGLTGMRERVTALGGELRVGPRDAGGFSVRAELPLAVPADLLYGVRVAARGDALLSPAITRRLIGEFVSRPPRGPLHGAVNTLTNREREVVALAAWGLSNDEIAGRMVISLATAKTHISRAMTKLHARDRAQLVVFAYESGLVTV